MLVGRTVSLGVAAATVPAKTSAASAAEAVTLGSCLATTSSSQASGRLEAVNLRHPDVDHVFMLIQLAVGAVYAVVGLTVVTNAVRIAEVLHEIGRSDQTIILTGGVRTPSDALVGPFAVAALRTVHVDLVFLGVHGMDEASGFTSPNLLEAETDRTLIDAGRRLVVVADHTKWGIVGLSTIAQLDKADVLITDTGIAPDARAMIGTHVRELVVVRPEGSPVSGNGDGNEIGGDRIGRDETGEVMFDNDALDGSNPAASS